jgi:Ser/Thr protein kinase RdoA (MazF antagonist)
MLASASFDRLARLALAQYGLGDYSLAYLQHSENVTFCVESARGRFVLRLHVPVVPALAEYGGDPRLIETELQWLEALARETLLLVPQPQPTQAGARLAHVEGVWASLLTWLDGEEYTRAHESEDSVTQLGVMVAHLHRQARRWRMPADGRRPYHGSAYFAAQLRALRPAVADGRLAWRDFAEFERALYALAHMMRAMPRARTQVGMIHGDIYKGNLLWHAGELRLIDFSSCALAPYLLDVAICLSDMRADLRGRFLEAYQQISPLPHGYQPFLQALYLGSVVAAFARRLADPEAQEAIVHRFPILAREYAAKFNRGEDFWE